MKSQNQILGFINQLCQRFGANCCTRGLLRMPRYLYMLKLYRAGFSDVFLISLNKEDSFSHHQSQIFRKIL
jgi:hypothetical protein